MRLYPVVRPCVGVNIEPHRLSLAEIGAAWHQNRRPHAWVKRIRHWGEHHFHDGPGNAATTHTPNIPSLVPALRELRGSKRYLQPTAVSLSDLYGHMALIEFDTIPAKQADFERVLRWRLEREVNMSLATSRLAYRLFHHAVGTRKLATWIMAASIETRVIESYEEACLQAGLLPVSVGLNSFHLFEFWRPVMQHMLNQQTCEASTVDECFFAHTTERGLVFFALRMGCPVFIRSKAFFMGSTAGSDPVSSYDHPATLDHELIATLQFYAGSSHNTSRAPRPLFLAGATHDFQRPAQNGSLSDLDRLLPWKIAYLPLTREALFEKGPEPDESSVGAFPMTALPALAALAV